MTKSLAKANEIQVFPHSAVTANNKSYQAGQALGSTIAIEEVQNVSLPFKLALTIKMNMYAASKQYRSHSDD
eukprot:1159276-Pelagomonas_calceolata.AAC.7